MTPKERVLLSLSHEEPDRVPIGEWGYGKEIINPAIQPEMKIIQLKKRYGKNITLWGGVPAGDLITSSPEQVRKSAEMHLRACKPGGGYIFGTSHSIMPGARYENYLAMLEAHKTFGRYD